MPRVRTLPIVLAALTLAAAGCGGGQNTSANQSTEPDVTTGAGATTGGATGPGDADHGSIIWVTEGCNNCHKLAGNPATSIPGPNFDDKVPDRATIVDAVTNGKGTMPAFSDSLSAQDVEDVAAYIREASGT